MYELFDVYIELPWEKKRCQATFQKLKQIY